MLSRVTSAPIEAWWENRTTPSRSKERAVRERLALVNDRCSCCVSKSCKLRATPYIEVGEISHQPVRGISLRKRDLMATGVARCDVPELDPPVDAIDRPVEVIPRETKRVQCTK